ncbi:Rh-like protein/ammonium transporter [Naviculisporaceae sp. PSN 640]
METYTFPARPTSTSMPVAYSDILKHPEQYYQGSDMVWVMISSAMVFIMVPALSFIYAGLGSRSFALTLFRLPMVTAAFVGLQWVLWGYALTFSSGTLWWGGELRAAALNGVLVRPISIGDGGGPPGGAQIPELVFVIYEAMFVSFTAALVCGGTIRRARPARFIVFITLWCFFVYFPIARWSWSPYGWSKQLGTLDFAGGTPVHIVSGTTVAAFSIFCSIEARESFGTFISDSVQRCRDVFNLGKPQPQSKPPHESADEGIELEHAGVDRVIRDDEEGARVSRTTTNTGASGGAQSELLTDDHIASNVNYVVFGTALLWFGWAGFNGGSALGGNMRAVSAWTSTHIAACAGGVTGMLLNWFVKAGSRGLDPATTPAPPAEAAEAAEHEGEAPQPTNQSQSKPKEDFNRLSVFYFCDGAIAGLVAITPGAGYVTPMSAAAFGIVSAFVVLALFKQLTAFVLRNDPLNIFAVHAGGGLVGMALTAFLVNPDIIGLDGHSTIPHPEYTMGLRLGYQLLDGFSGMVYTFLVTLAILYFMKFVAGIFHTPAPTDEENCFLEDEYQPTMAQGWRSGLDRLGRPRLPVTAVTSPASAADRPESTGSEHASGAAGPTHEGEGELEPPIAHESAGAPTSSGFSPVHTPASTSALSPAHSLVPTSEIPSIVPFHDTGSYMAASMSPQYHPYIGVQVGGSSNS